MNTLQDRAILITGAKGGLGTSVTQACLDAGARVAGVSRSIRDNDFPGTGFVAIPSEIGSLDAARALAEQAVTRLGRIDGVVHLVGGYTGGQTVDATDAAVFERMLDLNLRSAFYLFSAVIPLMRTGGGGSVVAVGSRAAVEPAPMAGAYAASKAALVSLVRTIASENRDHGISANIVLPGTMDTPANRGAMPDADPSRWVDPRQVAGLIVTLLTPGASQVSGAAIPVYGREA
ncbi:MAG: SDR family NAD(P)-dependent oxidoreductase [Acidobacteria bacterium]|nr:SDR family NAD(P)-dependent oxidoreductase [Acidobacteriota bacterium]